MAYAVVENTPGYLPESDPVTFGDYADAVTYANQMADELEDAGYVTQRDWASADNYFAVFAQRDPSDLGRVVEVVAYEEGEQA